MTRAAVLLWASLLVFWVAGAARLGSALRGRARRLVAIAGVLGGLVFALLLAARLGAALPSTGSDTPFSRACEVLKGMVAFAAALLTVLDARRTRSGRPFPERARKLVALALAVSAVFLYLLASRFRYPVFYHRWDQYHYYLGSRYFPELGYDALYRCTAVAQDEVGEVLDESRGQARRLDLRAEVRRPGRKIRNLSADNLLVEAAAVLGEPDRCRSRFTPARWEQYKADAAFFATQSGLDDYWADMQLDHGYNPPPVWTLVGHALASLHGPGPVFRLGGVTVLYVQLLALLDLVLLAGMFALLRWAFGWRVSAVAAVFWGTQAASPASWTLGAMLRQDWLFLFVAAACLARRRFFALSGAALAYASLLRVFPALAALGWVTVAGLHLARHRRLKPEHVRTLGGAIVAAAVLVGLSLAFVGPASYPAFYHHTMRVHEQTPLTNNMGLRVLLGYEVGAGKDSGRMKYVRDPTLTDPFAVWKRMRLERYQSRQPLAWAVVGVVLALWLAVLRRVRSLWLAQCLGQVWIVVLSQITCYYYAFLVLCAPLTRRRRGLEAALLGVAAVSQALARVLVYNDDRYAALSLLCLVLVLVLLAAFARGRRRAPAVAATSGAKPA